MSYLKIKEQYDKCTFVYEIIYANGSKIHKVCENFNILLEEATAIVNEICLQANNELITFLYERYKLDSLSISRLRTHRERLLPGLKELLKTLKKQLREYTINDEEDNPDNNDHLNIHINKLIKEYKYMNIHDIVILGRLVNTLAIITKFMETNHSLNKTQLAALNSCSMYRPIIKSEDVEVPLVMKDEPQLHGMVNFTTEQLQQADDKLTELMAILFPKS